MSDSIESIRLHRFRNNVAIDFPNAEGSLYLSPGMARYLSEELIRYAEDVDNVASLESELTTRVITPSGVSSEVDMINREFVMSYMHHSGEHYAKIVNSYWCDVYMLADGFGEMTVEQANEQCYDWSHVRDSTAHGFERMATRLQSYNLN